MQLRKQALTDAAVGIFGDNLDSLGGRLEAAPWNITNARTELTGNAEVTEMVWAALRVCRRQCSPAFS